MKDLSKEALESARPDVSTCHAIGHALDMLYSDNEKGIKDEIVPGLTYEELIGTLLLARDICPELIEYDSNR